MSPQAVLAAAGIALDGRPERLHGGDMGEVWRCGDVVVKSHANPPAGMFPTEARGLQRLADAGLRVPEVYWASDAGLVMEWLGDGPRDDAALARMIATLHQTRAARYGSPDPLFIGRFALPAGEGEDWKKLFVELRMGPLIRATHAKLGRERIALVERVCEEVEPAIEGPVLVHGDLWSGNVHFGSAGPALIDPSCQAGERALDLGFMRMFGGFRPEFWRAYEEILPISAEVRRTLQFHQLYFALVHVHFFGGSYGDLVFSLCRSH